MSEVRISRSISESPSEFEITRVNCIMSAYENKHYIDSLTSSGAMTLSNVRQLLSAKLCFEQPREMNLMSCTNSKNVRKKSQEMPQF